MRENELNLYKYFTAGYVSPNETAIIDSTHARQHLGINHLQSTVESLKNFIGDKKIVEFYTKGLDGKRTRWYKLV